MEKGMGDKGGMPERTPGGGKGFLIIVVVIAVVLVGLWWFGKLPVGSGEGASDKYQAVFLTNNQVYFGNLTRVNSDYPVLRDVFYLQVTQALQPAEQGAPAGQNLSLIKLGGELHGPEDEMVINSEHILFYEDLKNDSPIVQKIVEFKNAQQ